MKKTLPLFLLLTFFVPNLNLVLAETPVKPPTEVPVNPAQTNTLTNPLKAKSLDALYKSIFKIIIEIGYILVAIFLLLAGFKFVTAQGSSSKLDEAKQTFYYTIVGALIVVGAQTLSAIFENVIREISK